MGQYAKIFKAYDIRGVVPDELDEGVAEAVGAAFVRLTGASCLVTAHDMRTSSPSLAEAFGRGASAQGADVVAAGLGSTDLLYYASGSLGVPGAMITASHNPSKYNGIKLCRAGARPVGADSGLTELRVVNSMHERKWGLAAVAGAIVLILLFMRAVDVGRQAADVEAAHESRVASRERDT